MKRGYAALFEFILKEYYNPPEADKRSRWNSLRRHQSCLLKVPEPQAAGLHADADHPNKLSTF